MVIRATDTVVEAPLSRASPAASSPSLRARLFVVQLAIALFLAAIFAAGFGFVAGLAALSTGLVSAVVMHQLALRWIDRRILELRGYLRRSSCAELAPLPLIGDAFDDFAVDIADLQRQLFRLHQRELSESKQAEQILDAMSEAVVLTSRDGVIQSCNRAFRALASSAGDVHPEGLRLVEALRVPALHDAHRAVLAADERTTRRLEIAHRDAIGNETSWLADVATLPFSSSSENDGGALLVLRDVTEAKRLDAMRRDFVANVSHELRTPLTSIRGFSESLLSGALDSATHSRRFVQNIHDASKRLADLVEDMLELSRTESPESLFALEPLDVVPIIENVLLGLDDVAQKRSVEIRRTLPASLIIDCNRSALESIVENLTYNAIKFSPAGGAVDLSLASEQGLFVLRVVDRGIGMDEEHLPRIFERFYRVDAGRSRSDGGTGLGLAIVKHMAERLHAEVSVKSRVGVGTTFEVRLRMVE